MLLNVKIKVDTMKRTILIPCTLVVAVTATGCTSLSSGNFLTEEHGGILIAATERGMQAFSDLPNSVITNTRINPDLESPSWKLRREQNQVRGLRFRVKQGGKK